MSKTLISVLSGLGGMFGWGTSDFFASQASEKVGHFKTLLWSQIAGIIVIGVVFLLLFPSISFSPIVLIVAIVAGVGYALGYLLFYDGFEIGNISVVSAVVQIQNIFIILIGYFLFRERVTYQQISGIILLLIGATIISIDFKELFNKKISLFKGVRETFFAAIMFGVIYWPLNKYVVENSHWLSASLIIKIVAVITILFIAFIRKQKIGLNKTSKKTKFMVALIGILEAIAILSISFGSSIGDIIIIAPISASLIAVTVGLAVIFLKEKLSKVQLAGIVMVLIGIILTSVA
jgi:drug/metabolite transporter (DMT)-like permease